jgi:anti-sigma regulatory factor (Ser/Thr protein kinase)
VLLNDAMLRQRSAEEFCTVAYARMELNGAGVNVTLSNGGHPLPLILRADGSVEAAGANGTLLGVLEDPELGDHTTELRPGEALVLYTDGLTDAYAPARMVTTGDLVAVLESCVGQSASAIADTIQQALLYSTGAEPRDDIALLVVRIPDRGGSPGGEVTTKLRGELEDIASARHALSELEPELEPTLFANLRLLVSELVTNSIRHAHARPGALVELKATAFHDRARVEVIDGGSGFEPGTPAPDRGLRSGWGLYLVDQLADRWGVVSDESTCVWFEIDR